LVVIKKGEKMKLMKDVLETYRCLISNRKNFPGAKLEEVFSPKALQSFENEYEWLQELDKLLSKEIKK